MFFKRLIDDLRYDSFSAIMKIVELLSDVSNKALAVRSQSELEFVYETSKDWLKTINNFGSQQDLPPIVSLNLRRATQEVKSLIIFTEQKLKKVSR